MVRTVGETDPELARKALAGLRAYEAAPPAVAAPAKTIFAESDGARLIEHGGSGPPLVLIPSLINPPRILDLDPEVSLASAIAGMGRRVLLVDWGPASSRRDLSVAQHVERLLLPLLKQVSEPPMLVGYCLGGTMAIAASGHIAAAGLVTLAAPWNFSAYPEEARDALEALWARSRASAEQIGMLPIEVLQAGFWSLDPERTVRKFARFADLDPDSAEARRFVALEEWANDGQPLPFPAARELIDDLFGANASSEGRWMVAGKVAALDPSLPTLHLTARDDRIAPAATVPPGPSLAIASGHVGMIVGSARRALHDALRDFLGP